MASHERTIRVVLADDSEVMRDTVTALIWEEADLEVVGAASDVDEAVTLVTRHRPDVAVIDLRMPGGGSNAVIAIRRASPDTHVIAFSAESAHVMRIRVDADQDLMVLPKGMGGKQLLEAIRAAATGGPSAPPSL